MWLNNKLMSNQARNLYKNLLYMGRDYPQGYSYFQRTVKNAFLKNKEAEGEDLKRAIGQAVRFQKDLELYYHLKKYRYLKTNYYNDNT